ncbi:MAG: sulfurtransferase TusA family protein [Desulfuromonadales bacterium]|nr:sulfurtransferase TusA family protein [Desulfuromonadales bacterium]
MSLLKEHLQDIRGQVCPSSLLVALRCINENMEAIRLGTLVLKIITDNRTAVVTIPNAASNMGFDVQIEKEQEGYYVISITQNNED